MGSAPIIPMGDDTGSSIAASGTSPRPWQTGADLSSIAGRAASRLGGAVADRAERFLADAGFDRAPWLAVLFAAGIFAWFGLPTAWHWSAAIAAALAIAAFAMILWQPGSAADETRPNLRRAAVVCGLVFAAGLSVIWCRSEIVGAEPIAYPRVERIVGHVLEREDQPAQERIRLTVAARDPASGASRKLRINVPLSAIGEDRAARGLAEGAVVRLRARLMPPANPMLPGAYDFARTAWFSGLAATGSALGPVELLRPAAEARGIAAVQRFLSAHVRSRMDGSAGSIAAAFASGDRGAIAVVDEEAMRDAGLTHLLSISGLHVSAVIAAAYLVTLRLLALWPGLALRARLPVLAAGAGALAGIGYTLLTGAEVPTVRSCVAAMLVLVALALGRDALSLRMVAVAAGFVLLLWPESAIGPSFQMSFCAVLAIVSLSTCGPVRAFLAPREESWLWWAGRRIVMLFATGLVIELALMPIVLFHFHRAGLYGALANVVAIPLVTFISMPLIALALAFDLAGLGAPFWWLAGISLQALLAIARITAAQPGAVTVMPQVGGGVVALFVAGGLWLALWSGRARLLGILPAGIATVLIAANPVPDLLIGGDGRQVGVTVTTDDGQKRLLSLRRGKSTYARDNLLELAGVEGEPIEITRWPGARCSRAFCLLSVTRGGRAWSVLMARGRDLVEERALAASCERVDIVIADRFLPRSCRPRWLKADRSLLQRTGGLSIELSTGRISTVADGQGEHGWWRGGDHRRRMSPRPSAQ